MTTIGPESNLLQFERMKVEELQPLYTPPPSLSTPIHSTTSSIAPAEKIEAPAPTLRPKIEHPALAPIRVFQGAESSAAKQARLFDGQITTDLATIDRLNDEKEAAIREFIEKEKSKKNWGVAATIFQYLSSAFFVGLGIAAIATGQVAPGVVMIVGAVGAVSHKAAVDLGVYRKVAGWFSKSVEIQEKIAKRIEIGAFLFTLTTSLAGGFWAYNAGAFANIAQSIPTKLVQSFQTGTSLMNGGFRIKEGYLQKQLAELQKKMKMLELEADCRYQNIDENTLSGKKMMESLNNIGRQLKNTIYTCGRAAEAA